MLTTLIVAANLIVAVGSWVQGSVGFGLALISAPLLLIVAPESVPGPLIAATFVLLLLTVLRERQAVDLRGIGWALLGRLPGTALGALTVARMSGRWLGLTLGLLTLLAVGLTATRFDIVRKPPWLLIAGTVSGFMGTTAGIGGPAMALLYQRERGPTVRASLAAFFVVGASMSMLGLAWVGRFGKHEVVSGLTMVPGVIIGFLLSKQSGEFLDQGRTRRAVLFVAGASGIAAVVRAILVG
ncbi:MAG TPA: sulfite exporter TauE/SafE family protein [Polyangiaceae bacterium]|nr:sulfite exporter TauE/SafE family protein [Polyangiaceae bacterium]